MAKIKSIITDDMEHCFVCGRPDVQIHHCIHGVANRKLADKYKLVVPLCMDHHTGRNGIHFDKKFDEEMKKYAQRKFEETYDEDFRAIFGKSYL